MKYNLQSGGKFKTTKTNKNWSRHMEWNSRPFEQNIGGLRKAGQVRPLLE